MPRRFGGALRPARRRRRDVDVARPLLRQRETAAGRLRLGRRASQDRLPLQRGPPVRRIPRKAPPSSAACHRLSDLSRGRDPPGHHGEAPLSDGHQVFDLSRGRHPQEIVEKHRCQIAMGGPTFQGVVTPRTPLRSTAARSRLGYRSSLGWLPPGNHSEKPFPDFP